MTGRGGGAGGLPPGGGPPDEDDLRAGEDGLSAGEDELGDEEELWQAEVEFEIEPVQAGMRLDVFLATRRDLGLSRSHVQKLIAEGLATVDGEATKPGHRLAAGETVRVTVPYPEPLAVEPEDIPLEVLYEDEHLVVVNKPRGMVVHPAPGHLRGTLVNALLARCGDLSGIGGLDYYEFKVECANETVGVWGVEMTSSATETYTALPGQSVTTEYAYDPVYLANQTMKKIGTYTVKMEYDATYHAYPAKVYNDHVTNPGFGTDETVKIDYEYDFFGRLTAADYEDAVAADPRIDALREKIVCVEDPEFTKDYHDPDKRSIANALTVEFNDGRKLKEIVVEYPIGHKRRRKEGMPILVEKFKTNLARRFPPKQASAILELCLDARRLAVTPVNEFVDMMVI
ncbi:MAG: hypothetical protein K6U08_06365 [Firmicutes bacterium]|nr:hypothetical protein [Bacillota bacterium]